MANTSVIQDVRELMELAIDMATGQTLVSEVNTQNFTTVAERALSISTEAALSAFTNVLMSTVFNVDTYEGEFNFLNLGTQRWGEYARELTPFYLDSVPAKWNWTNVQNWIAEGETIDHYEIHKRQWLQLNTLGRKTIQRHETTFKEQLDSAFHNLGEFREYLMGNIKMFNNEHRMDMDSESRMTLLNYMGALYNLGQYVDLVATYNREMGTEYTRQELLSDYLESFLKYIVSEIDIYSGFFNNMDALYHVQLTGLPPILNACPPARQKLVLYAPFFSKAKTMVYPSLYHPNFAQINTFTGVNYWQSNADRDERTMIQVTPNQLDPATGNSVNGDMVALPYVLGALFDSRACGVSYKFVDALTTPINTRGRYFNTTRTSSFNSLNNLTKKGLLFILGDGGPTP